MHSLFLAAALLPAFAQTSAPSAPESANNPAAARPAAVVSATAAPSAAPVQLQSVEVTARQEAVYNAIDRKVYNVGRDVLSTTGTASDLLQNIPSVQVDIEGNVSLRGDSSVQVLVNGKPSALMGRNRAAVLEQMPAGEIERIEVITNPSARFSPEGTGGIINLVMKRDRAPGHHGNVRASVGNDERYHASATFSFNPGRYTLFGTAAVRQDSRPRLSSEARTRFTSDGARLGSSEQQTTEEGRPLSLIARVGAEFRGSDTLKFGATLDYDERTYTRRSRQVRLNRGSDGTLISEYERRRTSPETDGEVEFELTFERTFSGRDHALSGELQWGRSGENEDSRFIDTYRGQTPETDFTQARNREDDLQLSFDYERPLGGEARLELGYEGEREASDLDFRAGPVAPGNGAWTLDPRRTNRFRYTELIHSFYGTYGRPFGRFGVLAGARFEHATIDTEQVATRSEHTNRYARLYPSLHLSYQVTDAQKLQLSYSHRVNRPDADELNPFPDYDDPFDLSAGNPNLVPENIHSVELGWELERNDTTWLAAVYHRARYDGITDVTEIVDADTLLTTPRNLATSRSSGLELGLTTRLADRVAMNFSGNAYWQELDASNLGLADAREALAWEAKLNTTWDVTSRLLVQLSSSYRARRLTAQGERHPYHITNLGLRYELKERRAALVVTVSDLFNTLRDRTTLDTPTLQGEITRRRSSRIVYVGFSWSFGRTSKRESGELEFDQSL